MSENSNTHFASLEWDENGQPLSEQFGDVYFSRHNGLDESRYVFIQKNNLAERWQQASKEFSHHTFVIGETGFGTGLNFLATWQLWDNLSNQNLINPHEQSLHFVSVEKHPLTKHDLSRALSLWPELKDHSDQLLKVYNSLPTKGFKHFTLSKSVKLTLIIDDAINGFNELIESNHPWFRSPVNCQSGNGNGNGIDAWFLDGFSPAKNPDMWSDKLFSILSELSHTNTTLSTFTVAGFVKRGLDKAGFNVKKEKGFGKKREMLTGRYNNSAINRTTQPIQCLTSAHTSPYPVPWSVTKHKYAPKEFTGKNAAIIGAGLAGCHTAYALANRGWDVTIIDSGDTPGAGASGNQQGVIYGKLSKDRDWLAQLNVACLEFSENFYANFWQDNVEIGSRCGVLQLAHNDKELLIMQQLQKLFGCDGETIKFLNSQEASAIAGVPLSTPAIYFPKLGWMNLKILCAKLLGHKNITFIGNTKISSLQNISTAQDNNLSNNPSWEIFDEAGNSVSSSDCVVIANSFCANQFKETSHLPLKSIRGQISIIKTDVLALPLKTVVCGEGYIAPAANNSEFTLGATFTLHNYDEAITTEDHLENLSSAANSIPSIANQLKSLAHSKIQGRTGFRCTAPDYLPMVGPVHNHEKYLSDYSLLNKNANASIPLAGTHHNNLFINTGHGSRGLAYTPLCAELLASQMNGELWPMSRSLATALHPGRFVIRDLIRNRL